MLHPAKCQQTPLSALMGVATLGNPIRAALYSLSKRRDNTQDLQYLRVRDS